MQEDRANQTRITDDFWHERFHFCALAAGFIAASEGRLDDALYVRELAYSFYEDGAFHDCAKQALSKTRRRA